MGTKKIVMTILAILLAVALAESASAQLYGDGWWDPSESGWGINIIHQYDTMFVCLYVYGQDGTPRWYSASLHAGSPNAYGFTTYQGQLFATTGPWFVGTYNPQAVNYREVGSMTFSPSTSYNAQLSYTVDGVMVSKQIERFTFRHIPLSGYYHGAWIVKSNNCGSGPAVGTVETISLNISETVNPGTVSGRVTAIIYEENGTYSCTMSGTYEQFGGVYEATTSACLSGASLQVTDFIPSEISFRADSVIYGPAGCTIVYTMSAVKAQTPPTYTVTAQVVNPAGGSVSPASRTNITSVSTTTFTVTTNSGYTASVSEGSLSGTTWTTAPVTSSHTVTVTFTASGPPNGTLGSKTNPIPMNQVKTGTRSSYVYYPSTANQNVFSMLGGSKLYFSVDTAVTGKSISYFTFSVQGFNNPLLVYTKLPQTKAGVDLVASEISLGNNTGDTSNQVTNKTPYDFSTTRWLYAIENRGTVHEINVTVQFMP